MILETRRATFGAKTLDRDQRTVRATIASSTPVERRGPAPDGSHGDWSEAIDIAGSAWPDSVPLLADHENSTRSLAGTVENIRPKGNRVEATLRLAPTPFGDELLALIEAGALRGVSVGYLIADVVQGAGEREFLVKIGLREVSLVPVGADPEATLRGADMDVTTTTTDDRAAEREARAEFSEIAAVAAHAARLGIAIDAADAMHRGVKPDALRQTIMRTLAERSEAADTIAIAPCTTAARASGPAPAGGDEVVAALVCRLRGHGENPLAQRRLADIARHAVERAGGVARGLSDRDALAGAQHRGGGGWFSRSGSAGQHTTSDFPSLLGIASGRYIREQYETAISPLMQLGARADRPDFKVGSSVLLSEAPSLLKVNEGAEITSGTLTETSASWALETYGRIFSVSFQALVNDDLGGIARAMATWALAAAAVEADKLYSLISGNGATVPESGLPLWHANHGNLAPTPGAPSVALIGDAVAQLRNQKSPGGNAYLNLAPAFMLVGPRNEMPARQLVADLNAATRSEVQPYALEVLVEPRITGGEWFVVARPGPFSVIEYGSLQGQAGPQIEQEDGFDTLGTRYRAIMYFGGGIVDYRGCVKNAGAA